jgi:linearmycin/streptolysin S transport system permease protein
VKALVLAATDLRRLVRWRANVFFLFLLPMLLILVLGATFGSGSARVGVVAPEGALARELVSGLDALPSVDLTRFDHADELRRAVSRGRVEAGLVLPPDYDEALAGGRMVSIDYLARPDTIARNLRGSAESVVTRQAGVLGAARLVERTRGIGFEAALARARAVETSVAPVDVAVTAPDGSAYVEPGGRFESGASTQLLLFVFLASLNSAVWLIETRRLGVARRVLSTPTSTRTLIAGIGLGRLGVALLQALLIVVGSLLLFGVHWGDPAAAAVVIVAFCLVGTGSGMLLGSLASSEEQAGPLAVLLGLGLAALGGSMVPLEVFPEGVRQAAHVTPHAWANDAFAELLDRGGGLADVLPQVAVLLAFAAALGGLATWSLRRTLTR